MVIGDMPPPPSPRLPRGPFCMPLKTSSKPMIASLSVVARVRALRQGNGGVSATLRALRTIMATYVGARYVGARYTRRLAQAIRHSQDLMQPLGPRRC